MVKSYSRFEQSSSFGVIASNGNVTWLPPSNAANSSSFGRGLVPGLEDILIWDIKTATLVSRWKDPDCKWEVSRVSYEPQSNLVAAGYVDGSVRLWDASSGTVLATFNGHKSAISSLLFDSSGTRLVSGSKDSNIIVWDLIAEVGLYRLRGHRDQVTAMKVFGDEDQWLISVSTDGSIKLWDLATQHCTETHIAHRKECYGLDSHEFGSRIELVTCGSGTEVKIWEVDLTRPEGNRIFERGTIKKQSGERGICVKFHFSGDYFAVANADKSLEIFRRRSEDEVKRSVARKRRRRKEKGLEDDLDLSENDINEIYVPYTLVRTPSKLRSFDFIRASSRGSNLEIIASLTNNSLESYSVEISSYNGSKVSYPAKYSRISGVELPGHRSDIRTLTLSSDEKLIASASNGLLKVWNVKSKNCLRTFECGYSLCTSFLPGDGLIVNGTKAGTIELFDLATSSLLESVDAHEGAVWSLDVSKDGRMLVTGGADKILKFWEFKIVQEEVPGTTRTYSKMKLKHTKSLELGEDILSVKLSPDSRLVAVSLLDNTVKVFFADSLKFFLNLYGHKLPVLSIDISSDSKLLISSSADKNIKIWGLDFGDCHRSLFAHQDSVMQICFEPNSHNFFSVSKDHLVKYWDGDKFEQIQKLEGHRSEVWALAVANSGTFIVTGSHDKSIRIWGLTDEPLFIEEEREKELEELYESTLTASLEDDLEKPVDEDGLDIEEHEVSRAGKQTIETLKAGERLMEALDIGVKDLDDLAEYEVKKKNNPGMVSPSRNVILATLNVSAEQYVFNILQKIKPSQLEDALLVFSFDKVISILRFIEIWTQLQWNTPLVCRVLFFTLRVHYKQIIANNIMRPSLENVAQNLRKGLHSQKDRIGYNMAGLEFIKQNWNYLHKKEFFDDFDKKMDEENIQKKRAFSAV